MDKYKQIIRKIGGLTRKCKKYDCSFRLGSWFIDALNCRVASRIGSNPMVGTTSLVSGSCVQKIKKLGNSKQKRMGGVFG